MACDHGSTEGLLPDDLIHPGQHKAGVSCVAALSLRQCVNRGIFLRRPSNFLPASEGIVRTFDRISRRPAMPSLRCPGGEGGRHARRQEILPDGLAIPAETGKIREGRKKPPPAFRRGVPNPSKSLEPTQTGLAFGGPTISYVLTAWG